jgi:hypothetical protein
VNCKGKKSINIALFVAGFHGIRQFGFSDAKLFVDFTSNAWVGQEQIHLGHFDRGVVLKKALENWTDYCLGKLALEEFIEVCPGLAGSSSYFAEEVFRYIAEK